MRAISLFLIITLLSPLMPNVSAAQLLPGPIDAPSNAQQIYATQAVTSSSDNALQAIVADDYVLGPGDKLEAHLIVGDNALVLDYTFFINPEGKIFFPNVAEVTLAGLTLKQAKSKLTQAIKKKYSENFDLFLLVSSPKSIDVYVTGQVAGPGLRRVADGSRISQVLKSAGVAKGGSDLSEFVYLKRQTGEDGFVTYKLKLYDIFLENENGKNMALKNGDIIAIPAIKSYVYVYGEIARGGTFGYVPGQTLSDYINLAGGPKEKANLSATTVTRHENGRSRVYHVNAADILQKGMADKDIEILPGDVINVPGNFFYVSDFTSFLNTILLALTLYTTATK